MRKLILSILALSGTMQASADEYPYFSFQNADGTTVSMSVESLQITFSGDRLIAKNASEKRELSFADLSRMFFSAEAAAISELPAAAAGGVRKTVYSLSGVSLGSFGSLDEIKERLGSGMYIVKDNGNTTKIMVR